MKRLQTCINAGSILLTFLIFQGVPVSAHAAFYYKSYIVRYDRGWEVLCDPYVVKKNDWVLKLFKQKGEISQRDFPEFLRIFKRLNPHIKNTDIIRPGQQIFIPLKKLNRDSLPGQSTGVVTIPYVTLSKGPKMPKASFLEYLVKKGDCVSKIISEKYAAFGTKAYYEGIKLFKLINPDISDINLIYEGQKVRIPDQSLKKQPWYQALIDGPGQRDNDSRTLGPDDVIAPPFRQKYERGIELSPLAEATSILDGKLLNRGHYYFPRKGSRDYQIDLSKFPILQLKDGTRMLIYKKNESRENEIQTIRTFLKDINVVKISPDATTENILDTVTAAMNKDVSINRLSFADKGIMLEIRAGKILRKRVSEDNLERHICITYLDNPSKRTPESICRYLEQNNIIIKELFNGETVTGIRRPGVRPVIPQKNIIFLDQNNKKIFVENLLLAIGFKYTQNVSITFPYAGIQIEAVTNLITTKDGNPLFVDFEDLYGDAVTAITKTGFNIIQIKSSGSTIDIVKKLLTALEIPYTNDPTFLAAKRPAPLNISLKIPGFLLSDNGQSSMFLSVMPLHSEIIHFLNQRGIKIIVPYAKSDRA